MTYYVQNKSKYITDDQVKVMIGAAKLQVIQFCKDWRIQPVDLLLVDNTFTTNENPQYFIEFVDVDPTQDVAYHTENGRKIFSKIFCAFILSNSGCILNIGEKKNGELEDRIYGKDEIKENVFSIASAFSHEVLEQLCNPHVNLWNENFTDNSRWSHEVCDPVQGDNMWISSCGYRVAMSDYVLPSFFNYLSIGPYDWKGILKAPFSVSDGGYGVVMKNGSNSSSIVYGMLTPKHSYDKKIHRRLNIIIKSKTQCSLL